MTLATAPAVSTAPATVLSVRNLSINAKAADGGVIELVRDVSFDVYENEVLGIVGESGSGKTTLGLAAVGLLPIKEGKLTVVGTDISTASNHDLKPIRRKTGILGQLKVSDVTAEGAIANPLPGFGPIQPKVGDELILPPQY